MLFVSTKKLTDGFFVGLAEALGSLASSLKTHKFTMIGYKYNESKASNITHVSCELITDQGIETLCEGIKKLSLLQNISIDLYA